MGILCNQNGAGPVKRRSGSVRRAVITVVTLTLAGTCLGLPVIPARAGQRQAGGMAGVFALKRQRARRFPQLPGAYPLRTRPRLLKAPQDLAAVALLQRKLRPLADYSGEQVTEVRSGQASRQRIVGDTHGRVRVDYIEPAGLAGDILIISPDQFRNFHHSTNTLDVALWPTAWNERDKRIVAAARQGRLTVRRTGEESLVGRTAEIVEISAALGAAGGQARYWIDSETGIQLKNEVWNAGGFVSRTYITRLVIGPDAGVTPRDFAPDVFRFARVNPLFPRDVPEFGSVQQAGAQLPFPPLEPSALPAGFHLSGVWPLGGAGARLAGKGAILLRYSDNVTNFSLYERRLATAAVARPPRSMRGGIQRWIFNRSDGQIAVVYIGQLAPEQAQALYLSFH